MSHAYQTVQWNKQKKTLRYKDCSMSKHNKREKKSNKGGTPKVPSSPHGGLIGNSSINIVILILAVTGALLTAYLTITSSFQEHPALCSEGSACAIVQNSRWSTFLAIPMALWGCLTYVVMAGLAWRAQIKPGSWSLLIFVAICGFAISAYLTAVSILEIKATCSYCLASFAIITTIMILTVVRKPTNWTTSVKEAAVVGALIVIGLHLHYSGIFDASAGPEDPQLKALAIHLEKTGVKFYGAYWCPRCQEQKTLFGSSAKRLPYVECSSGGRGSALTPPCAKNKIRSYPTWIIGDKRLTGLQKTRQLANASSFDWKD